MSETLRRSPYQGLEPYTEADYAYFFGRDQEITTLVANLSVARLTLFYGPSGVGKSSVLRAGVLHQLQQQAQATLATEGRPQLIPVYFKQWHDNPLAALCQQIQTTVGQLDPTLADEALPSFATLVARLTAESDSDLLLILDQFEEYFLYAATPGADDFAQALIGVVNSPALRVNFLLGLREDALARLDHFKGRIPFLLDNRLTMPRLSYAGAQAAIEKPLAQWSDDQGRTYTIEPALTAAILDQLTANTTGLTRQGQGAPSQSAGGIETPYLQLVLDRLWAEEQGAASPVMRLATLTRLHDTPAIVANYLNATMTHLTDDERALAARFFDRLVTPSGSKVALAHADLLRFAGAAAAVVEPLVQMLLRQRILQAIPSLTGETHYEITHDVLGQAILAWQERYLAEQAEAQRLAEEQAARAAAEQRERYAQAQAATERRHSRRLRLLLSVIGVLLLGAVSLTVFALNARTEAQRQTKIAFVRQLAAQSDAAMINNYPRSLLLSVEASTFAQNVLSPMPLGAAGTALHTGLEGQSGSIPLVGHEDSVWAVSFSFDGQWLASGSEDNTIRIWSVGDWDTDPLILHGHEDDVTSVAFSPNGQWLASGSEDNTIRIWSVGDWDTDPLILHGHEDDVTSVAFSPNGQWLASGSWDNTLRVWQVNKWNVKPLILRGHSNNITSVAFSANSKWLASGSWDKTLRLWFVEDWDAKPLVLFNHEDYVWSVAFSSDNKWLASGSRDDTIRIWQLGEWDTQPLVLRGHEDDVNTLAFSPDSKWLASGSLDNIIHLRQVGEWDIQPLVLRGHENDVWSVAFSSDSKWLSSGSWDATLRVWQVGNLRVEPIVLTQAPTSLAFSRDGQWLASGSLGGTLLVWQVGEWNVKPLSLHGQEDYVTSVSFSLDNKWLASGSWDNIVRVWQVGNWNTEPLLLRGHKDHVTSVAFSPNGKWLVSGSEDNIVRVWRVGEWNVEPLLLHGHKDDVTSVAFSPDGKWLASGSRDNTLRIWQAGDWNTEPLVLDGKDYYVKVIGFSIDSQWLVSGYWSGALRVWRIDDWNDKPVILHGHEGIVNAIDFSADGKWLASSSWDRTVRMWQVGEWDAEPLILYGHEWDVEAVSFSPNNKWLASGSWRDNTLRIWTVPLSPLIDKACRLSGRNFTLTEWRQYFGNKSYRITCPQWPVHPSVAQAASQ